MKTIDVKDSLEYLEAVMEKEPHKKALIRDALASAKENVELAGDQEDKDRLEVLESKAKILGIK